MMSFIYVIAAVHSECTGPVKLGLSNDPDRRVRQLQTGHAEELHVFYRQPVEQDKVHLYERMLHRDNRHHRLRGEWFNMTVEHAICYVKLVLIEYDLEPAGT
jgi:hypothetical protein